MDTIAQQRRDRSADCDKLKELADAIQSFVCHVNCIAGEVSTPEGRKVAGIAKDFADDLVHDLGSEIRGAMMDLGRMESVHLVGVLGTVNDTERR